MKKASTTFLQLVTVLIGIAALAFLLWEPHVEGVNANATSWTQIYLDDPLLAYAYIASIPFFVALYQAFLLLGNAGRNAFFVQRSVNALHTIQYCAMATVVFIAGGVAFLLSIDTTDDRPPIMMMGIITSVASIVIATAAGMSARLLQNAVDLKSENDLTV